MVVMGNDGSRGAGRERGRDVKRCGKTEVKSRQMLERVEDVVWKNARRKGDDLLYSRAVAIA